jgi:hypothetical protein
MNDRLTMYTAMTDYGYSIGGMYATTSAALSGQQNSSLSGAADYTTGSIILTQSFTLPIQLTTSINWGFIGTRRAADYAAINNVDITGTMPFGERVTAGLGATGTFEREHNERIGFYATSSWRVTDGVDLDLRLEHTNYHDFLLPTGSYGEFLTTGTIVTHW